MLGAQTSEETRKTADSFVRGLGKETVTVKDSLGLHDALSLLLKVSSLLEKIIETLDILEDKETMKSIKQAEKDIKTGRVRSYKDSLKKLKQSGKI